MLGVGDLFFDAQMEETVGLSGFEHQVAFGFDCARDVASAARVVEDELEDIAAVHLLEADFRVRPVERAFDSAQIEMNGFAARFHV
jgi:hypothetical protein